MGFGKQIDIECDGQNVVVRDHGRGIPLEKLLDCSPKLIPVQSMIPKLLKSQLV